MNCEKCAELREAKAILDRLPKLAGATMREAVDIIKRWHGEDGWDIYWQDAPEMDRLRKAFVELGLADTRGKP